jgi:hypothetical protein
VGDKIIVTDVDKSFHNLCMTFLSLYLSFFTLELKKYSFSENEKMSAARNIDFILELERDLEMSSSLHRSSRSSSLSSNNKSKVR